MKIPLFRPSLPDSSIWKPWYDSAVRSGQLTNFGKIHDACVERLEQIYGGSWLLTNNGTTAIEAALSSLPKSVKRVAVPDFTFAATALAVLRAKKKPVIVPCGADMGMYPHSAKEALSKVDAFLLVSPFGYYAKSNHEVAMMGKPVIWDNAGAFPDFDTLNPTSFSLHAAKSLPIGEGGMVRFPNAESRDAAKRVISFGFNEKKECIDPRGFNGKMDELHCAVLMGQISRTREIQDRIMRRVQLIRRYETELEGVCDPWPSEALLGSPSIAVLRLHCADDVVKEGERRGIAFRRYYAPLLSEMRGFKGLERITGRSHASLSKCVALPSSVDENEFKEVVDCIRSVLEK